MNRIIIAGFVPKWKGFRKGITHSMVYVYGTCEDLDPKSHKVIVHPVVISCSKSLADKIVVGNRYDVTGYFRLMPIYKRNESSTTDYFHISNPRVYYKDRIL